MFDRIIKFSLSHRLLVITGACLVLGYGGWVLTHLPVDVFPDLNRPTVTVLTESGGLAPEEVEVLVSYPLEVALNGTPGLIRMRSESGPGLSVIFVEFEWGTDIYRNRQLVAEKLELVKESLPEGVNPLMAPISSIMGEIQLVGLTSDSPDIDPIQLRTIADWTLRPRLLAISGISQVIPIGGGKKQYQVYLSAEKLKQHNFNLESIEQNLSHMSENTTGGFLNSDNKEYLIRNLARVNYIEEIEESIAGIFMGNPIKVGDVAEVKIGPQVKRGDAGVNTKPGVILGVFKQPGTSTIELTEQVSQTLQQIEKTLPEGVKLHASLFKQANFIELAVENVQEALRDGAILVTIILFLFLLNFRTTIITLTAIPLSFVITFIIFDWFGMQINTMTLGGLAIAIGELVDDAIVDVENAFRRLKENRLLPKPKPSLQVVFDASREVRNSIVFATVLVVLVFVPLLAMGGLEGRFFIPLGVSYVVSLIASLLVSLTVTPVLCSVLLPKMKSMNESADGFLVRHLKAWDKRILDRVVDRPMWLLGIIAVMFTFCCVLATQMGREFLPHFNEGTALVTVRLSPGVSLPYSDEIGRKAEGIILTIPEVRHVSRRTGRAEEDEHTEGVYNNEIDVDFKPGGRPRGVVLNEIREKLLTQINDIKVNLGQPISHRLDHLLSGVRAQIAVKIFGTDLSSLQTLASQVFQSMEPIEGIVDLEVEPQTNIPQIKIRILRDEARRFNIVAGDLANQLELGLDGKVVAKVIDDQKIFDIFVRLDEASRSKIENIRQTPVRAMPDGRIVLLQDVADVYESQGPNLIKRENMERRIIVQANTYGRSLDLIIADIEKAISENVTFPNGYYVKFDGQFKNQQDAAKLMGVLAIFSVIAMFLVLYSHFGSAGITLQILFNIPQAFMGSVLALYFSGGVVSVASMVAFVALCGIASRNGIMMISHYIHLMEHEGEGFTKQMVIRGSLERLVPVLMTALTSVLGLIPLVLSQGAPGKEILHPVAVVVVGGLLSSTLLDMWVTPTVFYRFSGKFIQERMSNKKETELIM